ncbi:hypothetical protein CP965_10095 [Halarcobacter mediterraneus]|uniref:Uncharacterized protein n=1 Tax=Halarcobacter mediterraneus TaxID=2023153 RepID=A0A4Q1ATQ9_9BACT|nr:phosphate-starvation-inducible PsiE family protein [Halarcobacter mediterraneus]RXK12123.1 hypothetical protein CP965_10095 [Halarcobacter mediterraneus]
MRRFMKFFQDKFYIEIIIASILFIVALFLNLMLEFIIYMLYFIIYLEIVRAVINFIREQRVIISFLVDAFIILALRELIVNLVKINNEKIDSFDALLSSNLNYNILIISGVILFLFIVRYLSIKTSPKYLIEKLKKEKEESQ